ncbi:hypothetical protein [Pseudomonas aeruginosa]|uniref:hypothetical protein n=1 Tax=Pseudomonas aeruginosa TaxID=287 RepID=UPI0021AFC03B|nr:hypothetical protein [Pseudomonas aeruginosa]
MSKELNKAPVEQAGGDERIVGALRAEVERSARIAQVEMSKVIGLELRAEEAEQERDAALARVAELTATRNRYGVDAHYFNKNLQRILRDFENFTPDELARSLIILAKVADEKVVAQAQHSVPDELRAMLAAEPGKEVPQAWIDVQAERRRQITAEGWTPEHDDEHGDGQMALAAASYAAYAHIELSGDLPFCWPWDQQWWKPTAARRDMVKACALGLAEIERLDRAAAPGKEGL